MITPENLVRHELIGLKVRVVSSSNSANAGISGKVVDETRNTLVVEKPDGREARIAKDTCVFSFEVNSAWVRVEGSILIGRPEDRIKKKFRKW